MAFTYVLMIIVNALANILPINGVTTGEVAESYPNLFTPAPYTFMIWGLIYVLLAAYTIYQLGIFEKSQRQEVEDLFIKIGYYFSASSIANAVWIIAWHNYLIVLTMILMFIILGCLIMIVREINKVKLSFKNKLLISLPFNVYFGWITVATIANAMVLSVSMGYYGSGSSEEIWTVMALLLGTIIAVWVMLKNKNLSYGLVIIWAYIGILVKHLSSNGFAGAYPMIIKTVIECLVVLISVETYIIVTQKEKLRR